MPCGILVQGWLFPKQWLVCARAHSCKTWDSNYRLFNWPVEGTQNEMACHWSCLRLGLTATGSHVDNWNSAFIKVVLLWVKCSAIGMVILGSRSMQAIENMVVNLKLGWQSISVYSNYTSLLFSYLNLEQYKTYTYNLSIRRSISRWRCSWRGCGHRYRHGHVCIEINSNSREYGRGYGGDWLLAIQKFDSIRKPAWKLWYNRETNLLTR